MKLSTLPLEERPRERLLAHGPQTLSTAELIAILLGSGTKQHSVLELAHLIVSTFPDLTDVSIQELCQIPGLGKAKALQLHAALALAMRLGQKEKVPQITTARSAYLYIKERFRGEKREIFGVILLDTKGVPLRFEVVSVGTLSETLVHPRETFRPAIRHGAASVILVHNHPSGDPTPSAQDIALTKRLKEAGELMGIPVNDHLVIGSDCFETVKEHADVLLD